MPKIHDYFASCPKYLETLLQDELESFGCSGIRQTIAGVYFSCGLEKVYEVCLHSRLANRILMPLSNGKISSANDLYELVCNIPWESHFTVQQTFLVNFVGTDNTINNTQFGAQKVKDAIVDHFVSLLGERPSVDKSDPDIRINVRLARASATVSLDLSGESLHRRGYREAQGLAPIKENLAAAVLMRVRWPEIVAQARIEGKKIAFMDPMCGSGTLLIEAALMAGNIAPGLLRKKFGFEKLASFDKPLWQSLVNKAEAKCCDLRSDHFPRFYGEDKDEKVLHFAKTNSVAARMEDVIEFRMGTVREFNSPFDKSVTSGVLVCNPPYGERLGEIENLREDYRVLGKLAKRELPGWDIAVLTGNADLGKEMRLRIKNKYKFFNGTIPVELLVCKILTEGGTLREDRDAGSPVLSDGAQMIANRLKKNRRRLKSWVNTHSISCYRLYDADMPEYAAAIDIYNDYYHIQEYQAPSSIDQSKARKRLGEIMQATIHGLGTDEDHVICKTRVKHRGKSQYQKLSDTGDSQFIQIQEGKALLLANLWDYLDTGVFLDHRPLRRRLFDSASNKRFLNLFCYTATATVQAALGGAHSSISVDLSNTYLEWAKQNFDLNNINVDTHQLIRHDVVSWLRDCRQGFDLIMLDPPSFSNSKNTETVVDIQKDHVGLIARCMEILNPEGTLYFSTNLRSFKLDSAALLSYQVEDISRQTLDLDFRRNTKIHRCWTIRQPSDVKEK